MHKMHMQNINKFFVKVIFLYKTNFFTLLLFDLCDGKKIPNSISGTLLKWYGYFLHINTKIESHYTDRYFQFTSAYKH